MSNIQQPENITNEQMAARFALSVDKNTSSIILVKYDFNGQVFMQTQGPLVELAYMQKLVESHYQKMITKIIHSEDTPVGPIK